MDQQNTAGPESHPAEAPKRRRGAQPGNNNARRKAEAATKPATVTEAAPKRKGRPPRPKPEPVAVQPEHAPEKPKRKKGKTLESLGTIDDKRGRGRPRSIEPTEENFRKVSMLAKLRCTEAEAASAFECGEATFRRFLADNEKANEAWIAGAGNFCISLRRKQIQAADAGNVTMLIWLGKQFLGQKDKHEHSGDRDNPVHHEHRIATTPREAADAYAELIRNAA